MAKEVEFCTADELATRLRVTKATIYRMARRGELPYLGVTQLVGESSVREF